MLRSVKYGLNGAVLAGLIAAPVAWNSVDKTVHLVVDGHGSTVTTTASDVGQVLDAKGYRVDRHDLVAPSASSSLHDGMRVVLRHGRLLRLSVNGHNRNVWTTAGTVLDAMHELGYSSADFVSVSRSRRLPLTPSAIAIRTPRAVTVLHDGRTEHVTTTDATVGALLHDIGVSVRPTDRLSAPTSAVLTAGQTIRLQRVGERTVVETTTIPYAVSRKADPTLKAGRTRVASDGHKGRLRTTYSVVIVDGKEISRTKIASDVVRAPRAEVVEIGTLVATTGDDQNVPTSIGPPNPHSSKGIAKLLLAKRGWRSPDQFSCLDQMWTRESGWQTDAANPSGAYGIPQALPGSKMASAGPNWQSDATTQIKWGLGYIASRYGTPCDAWGFWQAHGWY